ncbi:MAG: thrombospondin type-1 domain-containing protein [Halobacteriovoraceae bacterium]|nr:thrombospondin type-1 domain-containing protein [Halobacteriovoraceae bacterium]
MQLKKLLNCAGVSLVEGMIGVALASGVSLYMMSLNQKTGEVIQYFRSQHEAMSMVNSAYTQLGDKEVCEQNFVNKNLNSSSDTQIELLKDMSGKTILSTGELINTGAMEVERIDLVKGSENNKAAYVQVTFNRVKGEGLEKLQREFKLNTIVDDTGKITGCTDSMASLKLSFLKKSCRVAGDNTSLECDSNNENCHCVKLEPSYTTCPKGFIQKVGFGGNHVCEERGVASTQTCPNNTLLVGFKTNGEIDCQPVTEVHLHPLLEKVDQPCGCVADISLNVKSNAIGIQCNVIENSIDDVWGPWGAYSPACQPGITQQTRSRSCVPGNGCGDNLCTDGSTETQACTCTTESAVIGWKDASACVGGKKTQSAFCQKRGVASNCAWIDCTLPADKTVDCTDPEDEEEEPDCDETVKACSSAFYASGLSAPTEVCYTVQALVKVGKDCSKFPAQPCTDVEYDPPRCQTGYYFKINTNGWDWNLVNKWLVSSSASGWYQSPNYVIQKREFDDSGNMINCGSVGFGDGMVSSGACKAIGKLDSGLIPDYNQYNSTNKDDGNKYIGYCVAPDGTVRCSPVVKSYKLILTSDFKKNCDAATGKVYFPVFSCLHGIDSSGNFTDCDSDSGCKIMNNPPTDCGAGWDPDQNRYYNGDDC